MVFLSNYLSYSKLYFQKQPPGGVLKRGAVCSKSPGERPCQSVVSSKLLCNFIEITLQYGCFPVNLRYIFGTAFLKNTSRWLLLYFKNHFKYMATSISIIILVLHIYSASILLLCQHINWSATIYLFKLYRLTFSNFFGESKEIKSKLHSIVLILW